MNTLRQRWSKAGWCLCACESWVRRKKIRKDVSYFSWYEVRAGTFIYQSDHSFIDECFPSKHFLLLLELEAVPWRTTLLSGLFPVVFTH